MRQLTFKGYLDSYVRYLAGWDTLAVSRLADASWSEPRLTAPLLLWAATTGRDRRLAGRLEGRDDLERQLATLVALERQGRLESALAAEVSGLPDEYAKVWRSYVARRDAPLRDAELKLEARKRVLALEAEGRVTRYRMAKDLGLNPGNLHAFLTQGDASKVSLKRAMELVQYLEAA